MKDFDMGPLFGMLKPKFRVISTALGEEFNPTEGVDFFFDLNSIVTALANSNKFLSKLPFSEGCEMDIRCEFEKAINKFIKELIKE